MHDHTLANASDGCEWRRDKIILYASIVNICFKHGKKATKFHL